MELTKPFLIDFFGIVDYRHTVFNDKSGFSEIMQ